jgi:hypothetical protein
MNLNSIKHREERKKTRMASKNDKHKYAVDDTEEEAEEAPPKK